MNKYKFINEIVKGKKKHVHTLGGKALTGVSSVGNVIAKPLTWWAAGLALEKFGWLNPKKHDENLRVFSAEKKQHDIKLMSLEKYMKLLDDAYHAHQDKLEESAEKGTDRHELIEAFVKDAMTKGTWQSWVITAELPEEIKPFVSWASGNVKRFLWSEMHCFSEKLWIGGICDVGYEDNQGKIGVLDIKSSKEAYPSQFFQCAGYATLIEENGGYDSDGNKIFDLNGKKVEVLTVFPFGMEKPTGVLRFDVDANKKAFLAEVELYRQLGQ